MKQKTWGVLSVVVLAVGLSVAGPAIAGPLPPPLVSLTRATLVAMERVPGTVVGASLEKLGAGAVYDVKIDTPTNEVVDVKVDARTGTVLRVEDDGPAEIDAP